LDNQSPHHVGNQSSQQEKDGFWKLAPPWLAAIAAVTSALIAALGFALAAAHGKSANVTPTVSLSSSSGDPTITPKPNAIEWIPVKGQQVLEIGGEGIGVALGRAYPTAIHYDLLLNRSGRLQIGNNDKYWILSSRYTYQGCLPAESEAEFKGSLHSALRIVGPEILCIEGHGVIAAVSIYNFTIHLADPAVGQGITLKIHTRVS
jgi:hypothetical protein